MQAPGIEPGTLTTITDSHIYNFITNSPSRMRSRRYTTRSQLRRLLYTGFEQYILYRGGGSGCAGCAIAHPISTQMTIFISFLEKKKIGKSDKI